MLDSDLIHDPTQVGSLALLVSDFCVHYVCFTKQNNLICDPRPNQYVTNDSTMIISLHTHTHTLFHLEPSEVCVRKGFSCCGHCCSRCLFLQKIDPRCLEHAVFEKTLIFWIVLRTEPRYPNKNTKTTVIHTKSRFPWFAHRFHRNPRIPRIPQIPKKW